MGHRVIHKPSNVTGECVKDIDISKCNLKSGIAFCRGPGGKDCTIMKEGWLDFCIEDCSCDFVMSTFSKCLLHCDCVAVCVIMYDVYRDRQIVIVVFMVFVCMQCT